MIRQFRIEDASDCCNLIRECVHDDASIPDSIRDRILAAETPDSTIERARLYYIAVYERENRIVGIVGLDLNEVRLLAVSPACRRDGIGRALIEYLKAMIPITFFSDIFVYASVPAVDFYRSCGFVERGPAELDTGAGKLRTVFMAFPLNRT